MNKILPPVRVDKSLSGYGFILVFTVFSFPMLTFSVSPDLPGFICMTQKLLFIGTWKQFWSLGCQWGANCLLQEHRGSCSLCRSMTLFSLTLTSYLTRALT